MEFQAASKLKTEELFVISPFIKLRSVKRLTAGKKKIQVLTRFALSDLFEGVSDLSALRYLLKLGAEIRGIKYLHSKLYLFGQQRAILTSANLTDAALTRNHELGIVTDKASEIESCRNYFDRLWQGGRSHVCSLQMLRKWGSELGMAKKKDRKFARPISLRDYGADLGFLPDPPLVSTAPTISTQAFIKFFGTGDRRAQRDMLIFDEIAGSESHWSLSYPGSKRPRQVQTGDVMFIGRMVRSPSDTMIYGRAVAYRYEPGRDDASSADKKRRSWKKEWSRYIRVRDPEFIDGPLSNGISLNELMTEFKAKSFASTEANQRAGSGNTNPRHSLKSKAQIRLSARAANWLNAKFNLALAEQGRIPITRLEHLYWPTYRVRRTAAFEKTHAKMKWGRVSTPKALTRSLPARSPSPLGSCNLCRSTLVGSIREHGI
jgi:hypothetical protein